MRWPLVGLASLGFTLPSQAAAQDSKVSQAFTGTRLKIVATGEVTRVPNIAIFSAGVASRSSSASGALQDSAARIARVISALKRAGIKAGDIQTSTVNLTPEYRYPENETPQLTGYRATNLVTVRFHDVKGSGAVLDALVSAGANNINGPALVVDEAEAALDQARMKAIAAGRARAELYARSLGMRVARVVSVNETDAGHAQPPAPLMMEARTSQSPAIEPGEQILRVTLAMSFELQ